MAVRLHDGTRWLGCRGNGMWLSYDPVPVFRSRPARTGYVEHAEGEFSPSAGCRR